MINELFDLTGKIALVTGSSRGLGYVFAEGLGQAGATVVLNGRDEKRLLEADQTLGQPGYRPAPTPLTWGMLMPHGKPLPT